MRSCIFGNKQTIQTINMKTQLPNQRTRFFTRLLGTAMLLVGIASQAISQEASTYVYSTSTGATLNAMTGATDLSPADRDDGVSTLQNIGFTFSFENINYTQFSASVDGFIRLGGTAATPQFSNGIVSTTNIPKIFPYWDDLALGNTTAPAGTLRTVLVGTSPNQIRIVEWFVTVPRSTGGAANSTFQLWLYETTNVIEFRYGTMLGPTTSASVGIRGAVATPASFHSVTLTTNTSSTTTANNANTIVPASGRMYTFTPPPFCSGTPAGGTATLSNVPGCGTGNFNLTGSAPTVLGITYQWQSSPDSINWTNSTDDTLVSLSKAPVNALTYFRRNTTCVSNSLIGSSNIVVVKPVYGGNAQATVPVCGDSLTLSLTNLSAGVNGFQWLESIDNVNWTPIFGATLASQKILSPTVNSFYRAVVTCNASTSTDSSVSVLVKAATGGTTTITASNCSDSTTLGVTGATSGTVTFNWLSSIDSVTWTPMGITTATAKFPSPTATRFYRRVITCGASSDSSIAVRVNEPCQGFGPYSITRNTGVTFTSIQTTGTQFTWASAFTGDDDNTNKVSMPFPFVYQGAVQSAFYVSTNGWLSFDTATVTNNLTNDLNSTNPRRVIAPLWEDLVSLGNNNANKVALIRHATTGTAPNRVLTVEWAEMERFGYGSPSLNFQVKLYEGSNNIELVYGRMQPFDGSGTGAFDYSLGLTGNNPTAGQKLALLLENSSNFSTSAVNNGLSILPSCNTSILFTSGGTFNPSAVSAIPSNDSSSTPIALTVNALPCTDGCGTYYSSRGATASNTAISPVSGNPDDDVWFSFTAPVSGQVGISVVSSSGYDPAFQVMTSTFDTTGLGAAGSRNAATNALESVQALGLTPTATYLVRVFNAGTGAGSTSGAFSICVNEIIPPPANDDTSGAITLTVGTTCTPITGTTIGATASVQTVCGGLADDDVWFKFTPSASVDTIRVVGSGTFRAHVQVLNRSLTSLSCLNTTTNGGTVQTVLTTGLFKDSTYYVRVYHTNAGTASGSFTICASGVQATAPIVVTGTKNNVLDVTASLTNNSVSNGGFPVTESGIVYSLSPAPVRGGIGVVDSINNPVVTTGTWSKNIAGLTASTTYFYRAYAINAIGITYGADSTFTTTAGPVAPFVTTVAATNVQATSATMGGNITSNGGSAVTASGMVYSTTPNPVIAGVGVVDSTTNPVVLTGAYSFNITGLTGSTKYYFRAYATNLVGTSYGNVDSFTTAPIVNAFPYNQNFDLPGNTGWSSAPIVANTTNDWQLGTPAKTFINGAASAPNAWVTRLTGNYVGSDCALTSPQFDFSGQTADPVLRFKHKFDTDSDADFDGGILEISINGGAWTRINSVTGTGSNFNTPVSFAWFNNATAFGPVSANKFAGISSAYSSQTAGWIESATRLTGAAGSNNVRFRFRFGADVFGVDEGWAIDDIQVVNIVTPTTPVSNVIVTPTDSTANVSFTNGNGEGRLVVARLTSTAAVAPFDSVLYRATAVYRGINGDSTGLGNYVVFIGAGSNVTVTGLTPLTGYTFDVYEFNGKYMHNKFTAAALQSTTTTPVKLVSFTGNNNNGDVLLNWITASEKNNQGFDVERSTDGNNFKYVGFVKGALNSSVIRNYRFNDENAFKTTGSNTLYYRLKQIDLDGKFEYSSTIMVSDEVQKAFEVVAYPVPFANELNLNIVTQQTGNGELKITDLQGRLIAVKQVDLEEGKNLITLNSLEKVEAGIYFVRISQGNQSTVLKINKQ